MNDENLLGIFLMVFNFTCVDEARTWEEASNDFGAKKDLTFDIDRSRPIPTPRNTT